MSASILIPSGDPRLEEVLRAQFRLERMRAIRELLQYILAFDGILVWLCVIFPRLTHHTAGAFAALMWPILFVFFAVVSVLEYRTGRRLEQILDPKE